MTPSEITPIEDGLLGALLAADDNARARAQAGQRADAEEVENSRQDWVRDCLQLLEMVWPRAPQAALSDGTDTGTGASASAGAGAGANAGAASASGPAPRSFGRFEVIGELGRGGFGVVYRARDPILGRDVALKVPRPEMLATEASRRRFMREARAAAGLDHPNIIPVHEADQFGPVAYIVSAYCPGPSLSAWLKARSGPTPGAASLRAAADLIATLARAVEHAHINGVLHRDLKPSNVLLQAADGRDPLAARLDELVPRLTDFGLAKMLEDDDEATRSGLPLGSPPYMSPEQAAGRLDELGPETDVYGLGATLYELLTGRSPFRGETPYMTMHMVIEDDPVAPRALRPDVPRDLETICLRCLHKSPARRYGSATALAADLDRFLTGRPIEARPASAWERGWKWARRRPAHAAVLALAALVVLGAGGAMAWSNAWLRGHNQKLHQAIDRAHALAREAEGQRRLAEDREHLANEHRHAAQLRLARQACDLGQFERAQEILRDDLYDLQGDGPPAVGLLSMTARADGDFAWLYLWRESRRQVALIGRHGANIDRIALAPDGSTLASADSAGTVSLWDLKRGRERARFTAHARLAEWLVFSPDGSTLATGGPVSARLDPVPRRVALWSAADGAPLGRLDVEFDDEIRALAFLDAGRVLAVVTRDGREVRTVRSWDLLPGPRGERSCLSRQMRYRIDGPGYVIAAPGGQFLAAREADGRLTLRAAADGRTVRTVAARAPSDAPLAVAPGGQKLAAAEAPHRILVWDLQDGARANGSINADPGPNAHAGPAPDRPAPVQVFDDDPVLPDRLVFSPGGGCLAAISGAWRLGLRNLKTGANRVLFSAGPERNGNFHLAFSPDGRRLAAHCYRQPGGTVLPITIFDTASGAPRSVFPGRQSFEYVAFSSNGDRVLLGGGHDVSAWRPEPPAQLEAFAGHHPKEAWAVAFAPDGQTAASGGDDDTVRLWDVQTGKERAALVGHKATVTSLAFSRDGRLLVSGSLEAARNVRLWDVATGRCLHAFNGHTDRVRSAAFSPDGHTIASGGSDRTVRLWDVLGGRAQARGVLAGHEDNVTAVAFSPDGELLASAGLDNTVRLWDVADGRALAVLRGPDKPAALAFSPDGRTIASAHESGAIVLWDREGRVSRRVINADDRELRALAFSHDGRVLASGGMSRVVQIWAPTTGQELLRIEGALGQINDLAFAPNDRALAAADHSGAVRLHRASDE